MYSFGFKYNTFFKRYEPEGVFFKTKGYFRTVLTLTIIKRDSRSFFYLCKAFKKTLENEKT